MTPRLSVVIVSYHSQADLARCLPSIARQAVEGIEIIVVDNAPGDAMADWLAREHPAVRVITSASNSGYAGGSNLGLRHANGEHVLILNPDTELHDGALAALLEAVTAHPDALITPKPQPARHHQLAHCPSSNWSRAGRWLGGPTPSSPHCSGSSRRASRRPRRAPRCETQHSGVGRALTRACGVGRVDSQW